MARTKRPIVSVYLESLSLKARLKMMAAQSNRSVSNAVETLIEKACDDMEIPACPVEYLTRREQLEVQRRLRT